MTFVRRFITPLSIAATLAIGAADYVTGVAITLLQLAYLAPLVAATWLRGRTLGLAIAVLASACVGAISFTFGDTLWVSAINTIGCAGMFVVVVLLNDRLRHYVERERLQRWAAVEQLRHAERLNVIGVLAAGVAHELGTPLNVIAGNAELIADDASPEERRKAARTILNQTDKISAIITHLLAFGRRNHGGRAVVELDRVARSAAELIGSTARKRNARIDVVEGSGPVRVRAADAQVEQVVSNLLLNAIHSMPRGGTVRVRTGVETRGGETRGGERTFGSITVEDEGQGIAEADLPRIFDPFFTTKDVGEGTGLGLSVSYGIVQDHGGSIEVSSVVGRGSSFVVLLPVADRA
ncbi:MAG: ATP-binding protein [Kofleriaceae bacterium]